MRRILPCHTNTLVWVGLTAMITACGDSGPEAIKIRVDGQIRSHTDGSSIRNAAVVLYRAERLSDRPESRVGGTSTDAEGYYSLVAEYPFGCGSREMPFLMVSKGGYLTEEVLIRCSPEPQTVNSSLWADPMIGFTSLIVSPDTLRLETGESATVSVTIIDHNGETLSSDDPRVETQFEWGSRAPEVATVSVTSYPALSANITAHAAGTAEIFVYCPRDEVWGYGTVIVAVAG